MSNFFNRRQLFSFFRENFNKKKTISNLAKILDKTINDRIYEFKQESIYIINSNQFSFVKKKGPKDTLVYVTDILNNKLDIGQHLLMNLFKTCLRLWYSRLWYIIGQIINLKRKRKWITN